MKYDENLKIELFWNQETSKLRSYYWRIQPKQLSWWNRLFHNSWQQLEHACYDKWNPYFYPADYWDGLSKLETVGDVIKYREAEWNKIQIEREKYIKYKIKFPYND